MPNSVTGLTTTRPDLPPPAAEAERLQLMTLVEQFEGMLLTEMLRDVRADADEEPSYGLGGSAMTDTMQSEFGLALSRAGGLGMGEMLMKALARQQGVELSREAASTPVASVHTHGPTSVHTHGASEVSPVGLAGGSATGLALPGAAVTSHYGWRNDPLSGHRKFHAGTDVRMAYGSDVRAAAPGVVASAGERPGYGLTVVVDHGGGRETLYAHLSAVDVTPGAQVERGGLIARSGNSGRTTGAHLHFEAREFGRSVDPRLAAETWTDRKTDTSVGDSVDSGLEY